VAGGKRGKIGVRPRRQASASGLGVRPRRQASASDPDFVPSLTGGPPVPHMCEHETDYGPP